MNNWLILAVLVTGAVVTLATSLIKVTTWKAKTKNTIAVVLSAVLAPVAYYVSVGGSIDTSNLVLTLGTIYGFSQAVYNFILKGTKADDTIASLINGSANTPAVEPAPVVAPVDTTVVPPAADSAKIGQ